MSLLGEFQRRILPVQHKLYRLALRMLGSAEEAEDVVQDVLLKVWNQRGDLKSWHNPEAWCMRMVKNLSLDRLKSSRWRLQQGKELPDMPDGSAAPYELVEQSELIKRIHVYIQRLPEKQRLVIQLRDVEGYSYQEIAEMLDISLDQVRVNLFRARKSIRIQLQKTESYGIS